MIKKLSRSETKPNALFATRAKFLLDSRFRGNDKYPEWFAASLFAKLSHTLLQKNNTIPAFICLSISAMDNAQLEFSKCLGIFNQSMAYAADITEKLI